MSVWSTAFFGVVPWAFLVGHPRRLLIAGLIGLAITVPFVIARGGLNEDSREFGVLTVLGAFTVLAICVL